MAVDVVTPFEIPELRRLLVSGRYVGRRIDHERIELSPADPSADGPRYVLAVHLDNVLPEFAPRCRSRRSP